MSLLTAGAVYCRRGYPAAMTRKLDLEDVYDPLPWSLVLGLAVTMTLGSWMVLDWAAPLSVELLAPRVTFGAMSAASAVAAAVAAVGGVAGLAAFLWRDQTGLAVERTDTHLRVVVRTRVSSRAIEVPLDDVSALRIDGSQLVLETRQGLRRVRLPGRNQEAHDALEAFLAS